MNNKITIAIMDAGFFPWYLTEDTPLARSYRRYYENFDMEYYDFADHNNSYKNTSVNDHGWWVTDRLLQTCGNYKKIKILHCKVFGKFSTNSESLLNAMNFVVERKVDLVNMSLGIPRSARSYRSGLEIFNDKLDKIMANGGMSIISAGNEGEVLSNGKVIDNTNIFTDDEENNISVASHNIRGNWDTFSSVGDNVDVSMVGSNLYLLGEDRISCVNGTSFSAPTFTGVCANYLIDRMSDIRNGNTSVKQVIYDHLNEAIKPVYKNRIARLFGVKSASNPWFGAGSFQAYANYFVKYYGRDVLRHNLFNGKESIEQYNFRTM